MEKKTRRLNIRLTEEDYRRLQQNANTYGCSMTELIRRSAIQGGKVVPVVIDNEGIRKILANMQRIGGNLNQTVHLMNVHGMSKADMEKIQKLTMELKDAATELRELVADIRAGKCNI